MELLCNSLERMIVYILVHIEPSVNIQAARITVCLCNHTLFMNGKEVDTSEHGVEMDDRGGTMVVCGVLGLHNPHPCNRIRTGPLRDEPINKGTWNDAVEMGD